MNSLSFQEQIRKNALWVLLISFSLQAWSSDRLEQWIHPQPFDPKGPAIETRVSSTLRALAFISGFKILAGHAFWIKVIQYYGDGTNAEDHYAKLYDYCSLASDLNPRFISIYTFGAANLAFNLHRPAEAMRLLQKGILLNPTDNRLKLMYAAIAYQNTQQYDKVIPFLEGQIQLGDAPSDLVNILANTYEKVGRYGDAVRLWQKILRETDSQGQRIEAAQKLQELYLKMGPQ